MLARALSDWFDTAVEILSSRPLGGGCISDVSVVTIRCDDLRSWQPLQESLSEESVSEDGTIQLVIKRNSARMVSNFRCEAAGLTAIADAGVIRVPTVHAVDQVADQSFLVMEWIQPSPSRPTDKQFAEFGRRLAQLHQAPTEQRAGWHTDNFLGSAIQPNGGCDSWPRFVATQRIGHQIRWAADQGLADRRLIADCDAIADRMDELLRGREETLSLLHGDLWSGNYLFDASGKPVLMDPAVYPGCGEAEWGMILWFGNCPQIFQRAYQEAWPMAPGWQRRVQVYLLYHQLNHLNLFGTSYASACHQTAREILG